MQHVGYLKSYFQKLEMAIKMKAEFTGVPDNQYSVFNSFKATEDMKFLMYNIVPEIIKKEFTDKLKDKLVNIDAKAMGVMFGLAARLFWTGATWTNPVGTTFTVFTIGPFKPIKGLPKDGAAGIAREIGNSFKLQLLPMTGLATPLPANAIPPFPFVGYN